MKLPAALALAFLVSCLSTSASGQAPSPSHLDELVERFMAIVDRNRPDEEIEPWIPDAAQEELLRLNPGREADIEMLLTQTAACANQHIVAAMPQLARRSARALGEERLAWLVTYLEGPGGEAIDRRNSGEDAAPLSEAEADDRRRFREDYGTFMYSIPTYMTPEEWNLVMSCSEEESANAARMGLRME